MERVDVDQGGNAVNFYINFILAKVRCGISALWRSCLRQGRCFSLGKGTIAPG